MPDQFSSESWPLSAPESLVLMWGLPKNDVHVIHVGLVELVARGYLELNVRQPPKYLSWLMNPRIELWRFDRDRRTGRAPLDALLITVLWSNPDDPPTRGTRVRDVAEEALHSQVEYRPRRNPSRGYRKFLTGRGFAWKTIMPSLCDRGLFEMSDEDIEPAQPESLFLLTPVGEQALADVRNLIHEGQHRLVDWVDNDPPRAWNYLERAGSVILLFRGILPHLRRLAESDPGRARVMPTGSFQVRPGLAGVTAASAIPLAVLLQTWVTGDLDETFNAIGEQVDAAWSSVQQGGSEAGVGE